MHVKHLLIDNETMSKSKGNFLTIPDLLDEGPLGRRRSATCSRAPTTASRSTSASRACSTRRRRSSASTAWSRGSTRWTGEGPEGPAAAACDERAADVRRGARRRPQHPGGAGRGARPRDGGRTRLLAEGALTRAGAAARPGRARGDGRGLRRAAARARARTASRPRSRRSSTSGRRRAGSASSRGPTRRAARLEALGVVLEDTPQGHALAAEALSPCRSGAPAGSHRGRRRRGPRLRAT